MRWPFKVALLLVMLLGAYATLVESVKTPAEKPVTLSEFTRVSTGMSYVEVEKIIGFLGTEQSRSELAGITTVMYSWKNDDGSNMNAMFQDGKLVTKAQFGLQ
jgi:hypothetical protein